MNMLAPVYIHGFNSGAGSRSARELAEVLGVEVFGPEMDYAQTYRNCIRKLAADIAQKYGDRELVILGSSLGGFYALQLRLSNIRQVIAWNPVVYPVMQLAPFTGENVRFTDGHIWQFGEEALLSYAEAPDARQWNNFDSPNARNMPNRTVILGRDDEVLDYRITKVFWREHARLEEMESGHRILDYSHVRQFMYSSSATRP